MRYRRYRDVEPIVWDCLIGKVAIVVSFECSRLEGLMLIMTVLPTRISTPYIPHGTTKEISAPFTTNSPDLTISDVSYTCIVTGFLQMVHLWVQGNMVFQVQTRQTKTTHTVRRHHRATSMCPD